ncbi:C45 family autoproteolytic acyltransferase/hydolase [Streptohalobacillus salinus]|uniref:C45 family autoproteolytic acyltransferase/hydolase n=1 Tax=Streptohalobacillus salinus TaxID=621096 RepID=UPI001FE8ECA0|nr:C45 family peptidase [Streptohalobacillus salinus]
MSEQSLTRVYADVIQFKGTHFDFGVMQGKRLIDSRLMTNRIEHLSKRKSTRFQTDVSEAIKWIEAIQPRLLDEIRGLQEVLNLSEDEAMRHFAGYYLEIGRSGCSIMTGDEYFVRNYDAYPDNYEGRMVVYQPTDGGFLSVGPSMQITGRTDGINEYGLVIGYNFTNRIKSGDGFICNMIARLVLESAKTVTDAIELLKTIPHRTSFSYVLMDPHHESVVVEATPNKVMTRQANMCTNHFELINEANRYRFDESLERLGRIKENWTEALTKEAAFQIFNNDQHHIFSDHYDVASGTLHTSLYEPKQKAVHFAIGKNQHPITIRLDAIKQGQVLLIKKLLGRIEWPHSFLNE